MTEEERTRRARALRELKDSPGGKILLEHMALESKEGWEAFIDLPVESKTSKRAYDCQAQYKVLKNLADWIDKEIDLATPEGA